MIYKNPRTGRVMRLADSKRLPRLDRLGSAQREFQRFAKANRQARMAHDSRNAIHTRNSRYHDMPVGNLSGLSGTDNTTKNGADDEQMMDMFGWKVNRNIPIMVGASMGSATVVFIIAKILYDKKVWSKLARKK